MNCPGQYCIWQLQQYTTIQRELTFAHFAISVFAYTRTTSNIGCCRVQDEYGLRVTCAATLSPKQVRSASRTGGRAPLTSRKQPAASPPQSHPPICTSTTLSHFLVRASGVLPPGFNSDLLLFDTLLPPSPPSPAPSLPVSSELLWRKHGPATDPIVRHAADAGTLSPPLSSLLESVR